MNITAALVVTFASFAVSAAHAQSTPTAQSTSPATAPAAPSASADPAARAAAAADAASRWLALMDAGQSVEAWDAAAPILQAAVSREAWTDIGKSVRGPLGAVKSRRQTSNKFTRTLPGVAEGEYAVIQYATDFANRAGVVETVVPMRQPDGSWKVTTYRLR